MDPAKVEDLERSLRLVEDITRFLVVIEDPDVAAFEAKKLVEAER
jgi:ribosomal protein S6